MIRKYVNLRTFFYIENWLADKKQLFPCLGSTIFGTLSQILVYKFTDLLTPLLTTILN